ncbi:MAG: TraB/GumN family protein [Caulobacter sp.]|nr:TraB/GumN family protein [Caulobacter sp.]
MLPKPVIRALAGLVLAVVTTAGALAAPALWAVKDRDSTIYLFGTMHVLSDEADWRTPAYDRALTDSTVVWFETDVDADPKTIAPLLIRYGFDFHTPLSEKVSPETMAAVRKALKAFPGPPSVIDTMQPWTAGLMIQLAPAMGGDFSGEAGADSVLNKEARANGQTVRYFESAEQQVRFFADLPQGVQVQFLEDSLEGSALGAGDDLEEMQAGWIEGDLQAFGSALTAAMRDERPELYDALIRGRNLLWTGVIAQEMRGSGVQMVNVGALHLVGQDGLVVLLRKRGFVVERVQ